MARKQMNPIEQLLDTAKWLWIIFVLGTLWIGMAGCVTCVRVLG